MAQGRVDEAAALGEQQPTSYAWPRLLLGLRAWIQGDHARAEPLFAIPPAREFNQQLIEPARTLMLPLLHELGGDRTAFDRACADTIQRRRWLDKQLPWHIASYLTGAIDEDAFCAQPYRRYIDAWLLLTRAVRSEHRGLPAQALADYSAWLALPAWRRNFTIDPLTDEFVAWRVATLAARP